MKKFNYYLGEMYDLTPKVTTALPAQIADETRPGYSKEPKIYCSYEIDEKSKKSVSDEKLMELIAKLEKELKLLDDKFSVKLKEFTNWKYKPYTPGEVSEPPEEVKTKGFCVCYAGNLPSVPGDRYWPEYAKEVDTKISKLFVIDEGVMLLPRARTSSTYLNYYFGC